jgi:hypothetical protein
MGEVRLLHRDNARIVELVLAGTFVPPGLPAKVDVSYDYWYLRMNQLIVQGHLFSEKFHFQKNPNFLILNAWDSREQTVESVVESIQGSRVRLIAYDIEQDRYGILSRSTTGPLIPVSVSENVIVYRKVISGVQVEYEIERSRISWQPVQKSSSGFL